MFGPTRNCGLIVLFSGASLFAQDLYDSRLFSSFQQQRDFTKGLSQILESKAALSNARRQYEICKKQNPMDPRLDYAMGLVYLKHYDYEEAGKFFQAATKADRLQHFPAWQAVIHLHLLQKDKIPAEPICKNRRRDCGSLCWMRLRDCGMGKYQSNGRGIKSARDGWLNPWVLEEMSTQQGAG